MNSSAAKRWTSVIGRVDAYLSTTGPALWPALVRLLLVALLWSRFAADSRFYRVPDVMGLVVAASFLACSGLVALGVATRFTTVALALSMLALTLHRALTTGTFSHHQGVW